MNKFQKIYDAIESGKTILCVGPMSVNCIDAAIEISNENDIPIIFIPSRRQVECKALGSGYVMNTEDFVPYVRERDKKNMVLIERDHGGLFQGNNESKFNLDEATDSAMDSYFADVDSGFDIIELDCSLINKDLKSVFFHNKLMYQFCEDIKEDEKIIYEFEFEEHSVKKTDPKDFENVLNFMSHIKDNKIKFIVGNVGLYVREMENIGGVDFELLNKFTQMCDCDNFYFKMHNCDYLDFNTLQKVNRTGVAAINVAPEFGVVETRELLNQLLKNDLEKEYQDFKKIAIDSGKWKKWMMLDPNIFEPVDGNRYVSEICGHYVFNHPEVVEIKRKAQEKFDLDSALKSAVKNKIKEYLKGLGWAVK